VPNAMYLLKPLYQFRLHPWSGPQGRPPFGPSAGHRIPISNHRSGYLVLPDPVSYTAPCEGSPTWPIGGWS